MKRIVSLLICFVMVVGLAANLAPSAASAAGTFADPAMQGVWDRTDAAVEQGIVSRTWIWGPAGFETKQEPYAEAPGGQRMVEYFDKSRMEVTNPNGDRNSQWFVTNGLLTKELVTGQMQTGDASFENRGPAQIPVAGDPDDQNGPTYASFAGLLGKPAHNVGDQLTETVDRNGNTGSGGPGGVTAGYFVPETNHVVASVFWDFLNSSGTVSQSGKWVQGRLFDPTFFATGMPISEAYWAQVKVAGQTKWVLMQAFERRVLTYTPDNPEGWKVEMGNVGRHYFSWRYESTPAPAPAPSGLTILDDSGNGYKVGVPSGWTGFTAGSAEMQQYLESVRQVDPDSAEMTEQMIAAGYLKSIGFDASDEAMNSGFGTNFNVVREDTFEPVSLEEYLAVSVQGIQDSGLASGTVSQQIISTSHGQFGVVKYQAEVGEGFSNLSFTQVLGVSGHYGFVLTLTTTANQEANYVSAFDQMIQSFELVAIQ